MIDEFGKANPMVKNGMMRVMLERTMGSKKLPEGSLLCLLLRT
jgi:MoxR-like ATPase